MANMTHVGILKLGLDAWNEWRDDHPEITPNLKRTNLKYMDLQNYNFVGANLRWVNFRYANLSSCDLSCSDLSHADFRNANLSHANLSEAILNDCDFTNAITDQIKCVRIMQDKKTIMPNKDG